MRRVVVSGLGLISSIGNSKEQVTESLRTQTSGIEPHEDLNRGEYPVRLAGTVKGFEFESARPDSWKIPEEYDVPRESRRSMAPNSLFGYCAMKQAIEDAGLSEDLVSNPRTGAMCASGGSLWLSHEYMDDLLAKGGQKVPPLGMVASIPGTLNFNLVAAFKIKGASLGFVSACASSSHAFGAAVDHIRLGRQDTVFVVGAEDGNPHTILPFLGLRALTQGTDPSMQPCAFDRNRDGFVVTGGGAVLVLEELDHALARGADMYAEVLGWGEASDGYCVMTPEPDGDGLVRAMENAIEDSGIDRREIDYINAHATSTVAGDIAELRAIKRVFRGGRFPFVSSTKSLTGHGLSLAGALEAAICCLSMEAGFVPPTANLRDPDPECEGIPIVSKRIDYVPKVVMSNSSGFGGANVSLILKRWS